jgi:hypothetical protein
METIKTPTNAKDGLYSNQIFFDDDFAKRSFSFTKEQLKFTNHARSEQTQDKNGVIEVAKIPAKIDAQPFEIEVKNGKIKKFCVKVDYDKDLLLALVIGIESNGLVVYTNWLDKKSKDPFNPDPIKVKGNKYVKPEISNRCDAANEILNSFLKI